MAKRDRGLSRHEAALLSLRGVTGHWWDNTNPGTTFAGSLEIDGPLITLRLSLHSPEHPFDVSGEAVPAVCGLVDGAAVTLLECLVTAEKWRENAASGYSARIVIRPSLILIGDAYADPDGRYSTIGLSTNEIRKVFRGHPLVHIEPLRDVEAVSLAPHSIVSSEDLKGSPFGLIERANLNLFQTDLKAIKGSLSFQFTAHHDFNRESGPSADYEPRLVIDLQEPVKLNHLMRRARTATHLMSLVALTPNYTLDIVVSGVGREPESWKVFQNGQRRDVEPSSVRDWQVLVRFPRDQPAFARLWDRWFQTRDAHAVPRWIFQSSLEQGHSFDINRFLNVMQCLEILTKDYTEGVVINKAEFDRFCDAAEVEARKHIKSEEFALIARMLRQQNRPPLAMRLRALASRLDDKVLRWLLGDELQALDLAVKARNFFTHFGELSASKRELVESNLGLLTCKMSSLYVLLELDILGIRPEDYLSGPDVALPWMLQHATARHITPG
jgi:hypothetical protein